ncbi:MAG: hypothetical protein QN198_09850 [Armatimonadota bacterium]|nr:hypothetical protein [Armatimonadota bacterium]MDR5703887.1 hypothetical protein [Armatimonadota bacterium]MDR7435794.1 hypothetical protein [Armatimonadota bacterium]
MSFSHRLYRQIDGSLAILGFDVDDLFVVTAGFMVLTHVARAVSLWLGWVRLQLILSLGATALLFWGWRRLKERLPRRFFQHLAMYLTEGDAYIVTPDIEAVPYII